MTASFCVNIKNSQKKERAFVIITLSIVNIWLFSEDIDIGVNSICIEVIRKYLVINFWTNTSAVLNKWFCTAFRVHGMGCTLRNMHAGT